MTAATTQLYRWQGTILYRRRYGGIATSLACCCPCYAGTGLLPVSTVPNFPGPDVLAALVRQGAKKTYNGGGVLPQWKAEFGGFCYDETNTELPQVFWSIAVCDGYNDANSASEQEAVFFNWWNHVAFPFPSQFMCAEGSADDPAQGVSSIPTTGEGFMAYMIQIGCATGSMFRPRCVLVVDNGPLECTCDVLGGVDGIRQ